MLSRSAKKGFYHLIALDTLTFLFEKSGSHTSLDGIKMIRVFGHVLVPYLTCRQE